MTEANEELIQSWVRKAAEGDERAYSNLLKQFRQLIEQNVKTTVVPGYDPADLRQEFETTLVESVNSFDIRRDVKFITHLYNQLFYTKNELIKRHERDKRKIVGQPLVSLDAPIFDGEGVIVLECEDFASRDQFNGVVSETMFEYLNQTENDVADLIIQGYTDIQIAEELGLTKTDIGKIKKRIKTKITYSRNIE